MMRSTSLSGTGGRRRWAARFAPGGEPGRPPGPRRGQRFRALAARRPPRGRSGSGAWFRGRPALFRVCTRVRDLTEFLPDPGFGVDGVEVAVPPVREDQDAGGPGG